MNSKWVVWNFLMCASHVNFEKNNTELKKIVLCKKSVLFHNKFVLCAKTIFTVHQTFCTAHQKFVLHAKKLCTMQQKNVFCLAKTFVLQIIRNKYCFTNFLNCCKMSHLLTHLLNFLHTFPTIYKF